MKSAQIKVLQAKIAEFAKAAIGNRSKEQSLLTINKITKAEAGKIKAKTGFDLIGYFRVIDNFGVLHTMSSHGDKEKEASRGQLAILQKDFELIPLIVESNNIIYKGKNRQGRDVILYEAEIGNKIFYAEEIRTRQKHLIINSMWKRKK
jgi:hypothetical protein